MDAQQVHAGPSTPARAPHFHGPCRPPAPPRTSHVDAREAQEAAPPLRWLTGLDDLAVIIVSYNSERWISPCLRSILDSVGSLRVDVVVVDADSTDGTADIVEDFSGARLLRCPNRGFAYANNRGLMTTDARHVLFINPDTKILRGSLSELVARMDERPEVGLAGVRQVHADGRLDLTIRRFPNASRALGDALSAEKLPRRPDWLGERELGLALYEREVECDWTAGSFMLARREAIESAGFMDERFFMYSEETDFCRRIRSAGWAVRHFPWMTILHYGAVAGVDPRIESLSAHSRLAYARKHFSPVHRALYFGTVVLRHGLRAFLARRDDKGARRRAANRAALSTIFGRMPVPHGPPSRVALPVGARPQSPGERSGGADVVPLARTEALPHGHPATRRTTRSALRERGE
jgi:N-acetylglucosaminyl-diphospho-decaprenol L-rhamnosyltransferase